MSGYNVSDDVLCRTLPGAESYYVVMNVGSEDIHVDSSQLMPSSANHVWKVHTSSVNSEHLEG